MSELSRNNQDNSDDSSEWEGILQTWTENVLINKWKAE